LDFQKEIDFVARQAQCSGNGSGRFAAALHAQSLRAPGQIQFLSGQRGRFGGLHLLPQGSQPGGQGCRRSCRRIAALSERAKNPGNLPLHGQEQRQTAG